MTRAYLGNMAQSRVARSVAQFVLSGLVAVLVLGLIGVQVLRSTARAESIRDAKRVAALAGDGIVEPNVTSRLLAGDPQAIRKMDDIVRARVLEDPVVRIKIWDSRGRVVYSDAGGLIGARYPLGVAEQSALRQRGTDAEVSDLAKPENRFERSYGKLLEVYKPIEGPTGEALLFEAYLRYSSVAASSHRLWLRFAPALVGGLLLLELFQIPLAYLLARRLRQREQERRALLQRAIDASELERRRLAAELHDGPVQSLAGVAFSLAAAAESYPPGHNGVGLTVREAAGRTRETMRELRAMLVGLYPASLQRSGIEPAVSDLLSTAQAAGIETGLEVAGDLELSPEIEALLFRAAREAVHNAVKHADPDRIEVSIETSEDGVVLTVRDDGTGFRPDGAMRTPAGGHFGLRLIEDLAAEEGGSMTIASSETSGTELRVEVPSR